MYVIVILVANTIAFVGGVLGLWYISKKFIKVYKYDKKESLKLIRILKWDKLYVLLCEKERIVIAPQDYVTIEYVQKREDMHIEITCVISDLFEKRWFCKEEKLDEFQKDISYKVYIMDGSIEEGYYMQELEGKTTNQVVQDWHCNGDCQCFGDPSGCPGEEGIDKYSTNNCPYYNPEDIFR